MRNKGTPVVAALTGCLVLATAGCGTDTGPMTLLDDLLSATPFIGDMRRQVAYDRYQMPRPPAEGTVPMESPSGDVPPPFDVAELATVAAALENPLPRSEEVLFRGEHVYRVHCAVCHADDGTGRGPVVAPDRFPVERSLVAPAAVELSDGYIYGIVRIGRGFMPAYDYKIPHEDRWAVVHYVRELQRRTNGAPPEDLDELPVEAEVEEDDIVEAAPQPVEPGMPAPEEDPAEDGPAQDDPDDMDANDDARA